MSIEDIALPGMPDLPTLWAVHVQGPDDLIAAVDRAEAERHAKDINDWFEAETKRPDYNPETWPRIHAEVVEWRSDRAGHAADLARGDERWEI